MAAGPRLLVTGFGPFPGAPENPTDALVRALAAEAPESFGASALKAVVLPTEYERSWAVLRRLLGTFGPDVAVHFGLSARAMEIRIETTARNFVGMGRPDASGAAPRSARVRRSGREVLIATLPTGEIVAALSSAGIPSALSHDAGDYVCNATLYRSLALAQGGARHVGFIHVPPGEAMQPGGPNALREAASVILRVACSTI